MGAQAASPTGSQVYYDTSAKKYYTLDVPQNDMPSGIHSIFSPLYNMASDSSQYRNYINNMPYKENATFTSRPYAELTNLFPGLNAGLPSNLGLSQGLMSSTQPDGAMYGAGRFLAPQTTNTQGK
jgi:hypothetical protein